MMLFGMIATLAFPLIGFFLITLLGRVLPRPVGGWLACVSVAGAFISAGTVLLTCESSATIGLFNWFEVGNVSAHFSILVDSLSLWMSVMITGVGGLIHVYALGYMKDDVRLNSFFAYFNLFVFFMLVLVLSDSFLGMFIGWEGVGLCSYLLIGFWYETHAYAIAAKKAFVMNRIGDLGFLFAILMMLFFWGTTQFSVVFIQGLGLGAGVLTAMTMGLLIGAVGKSAQIPLFTWLPDAMAGPTPVSALIHAATMVTAGVYLIARSHVLFSGAPLTSLMVVGLGVATAVFGALVALVQRDIKKVLAYSTMSQLGYMVSAAGFGAYSAALFHMTTHAFFKALLFLAAGNVIHGLHGEQDIFKMGGLRKKLPFTFVVFLIGTLAIVGCPPFSGFFSKDAILAEAFAYSRTVFVVLCVVSVMSSFYMFRLLFLTFFGNARYGEKHPHEGALVMQIPLAILAVLATVGGCLDWPQESILTPVLGVTLVVLALSGGVAYFIFGKQVDVLAKQPVSMGYRMLWNKFYVDEVYQRIIVGPFLSLSRGLNQYFEIFLGKLDVVSLRSVRWVGYPFKKMQDGNSGTYILVMTVGILCLLVGLFL